jgi:hypothetical protein
MGRSGPFAQVRPMVTLRTPPQPDDECHRIDRITHQEITVMTQNWQLWPSVKANRIGWPRAPIRQAGWLPRRRIRTWPHASSRTYRRRMHMLAST